MLKEGLKVDEEEVTESLKELIKRKIASFAVPNMFLVSVRVAVSSR